MGKVHFNYLFFGILFLFLWLLPSYNIYTLTTFTGSRLFFLIYTLGMAMLEVSCAIFLGYLIQKISRRLFLAYIGLVFLLFTTKLIDFVLNWMMDLTFHETLSLVFDDSWSHFIEMLYASNVPLWAWMIGSSLVLFIPLIGISFYLFTEKLLPSKMELAKDHFTAGFFIIPLILIAWDFSASKLINPEAYYAYTPMLPWKMTFLTPKKKHLTTLSSLQLPMREKEFKKKLSASSFTSKKRPNLYFFIIESLREDFITQAIAPTLFQFKQKETSFDLALSNANGTHLSWYSMFYGDFPHFWKERQKSKKGAFGLQILKKLGYHNHVITSSALAYHGMERILFGKNQIALDSYTPFIHRSPNPAYASDEKAIHTLIQKSKQNPHQNAYFVFLDATHFDYSFPKARAHFQPVATHFDYFWLSHNPYILKKIRNSYPNAIHFVDSLLNQFIEHLKKEGLYDEALIIITGDHGEEFYENKRLFHASHLSKYQTHVPIYMKLPEKNIRTNLTSHMDIFPSIFHALLKEEWNTDLMNGESVFKANRWPFVMSARYNMSRAPYEFFLHNGTKKTIFRFGDKRQIFRSKKLEILSVFDRKDQPIHPYSEEKIRQEFSEGTEKLFQLR